MRENVVLSVKQAIFCLSLAVRALLILAALFFSQWTPAQTASITALIDHACMGTRAARNLGCIANDFTAMAQFT